MRPITLREPFRAVFYAPFYAALARGAYAKAGVDVRLLPGDQPAAVKDIVLSGDADFGWGGPMRLLLAHDADHDCPLRLFGAVVMGDPFFLVGRDANPDFHLADLATLRLGSVSEVPTPWWTLQDDIRRAGLDPDRVARVTDRSMAENVVELEKGRIDVAQLFEPFVSALERDGGGHVWHAAASRGPTSYTAFYARTDRITALRDEFAAVIRGLRDTLAWFAAAPVPEIAETIAPFFPELDRDLLERSLRRYRALGIWTTDPRFPPEALERLETAMLSAGAIRRSPGFEGLVDEAFTAAALA
ncbi:ABC transporter substrate-binding protein [Roseomonas populi]|uniref:ABC transporter substrate-binding protein n=1 Tax=Roseomonas populi TaxID=3121582 RepID=A0ABT1X6N9_9PROT|nr:ABC transporter substrate-binding protein [Roseomonas pecuniae]MCR0983755.1 ABC transporter substrate-binding protein [Roseomonas pecuniae]